MYRHSPVRNPRSKGIKTKHVVQACLLAVVCFWLVFQLKRSHDKKKEFDAKITLNTHATDETVKFGRKDLQPKLEETAIGIHAQGQEEDEEENKHEEEEQDEDKIEDGGGGGDDEIDENEQEKLNMEIDRDEVDIIDEDKDTEEVDEEKDGESETESKVEDGSTHEAREEHYKADDASSAVITHDPENENKNGTLDDNSSEDVGTVIDEKDSESLNTPPSDYQFDSNTTVTEITRILTKNSGRLKSNGEEDLARLEVQNDLETMPEIETDTASE